MSDLDGDTLYCHTFRMDQEQRKADEVMHVEEIRKGTERNEA